MTERVVAAAAETVNAPATTTAHGDLFSLLDDFHVNLASHLHTDPDPSRLKLMEDQLLAPADTETPKSSFFLERAIVVVGNIARVSPNWRNRKDVIAKLLLELYVAIASVDKSTVGGTANGDGKGSNKAKPSSKPDARGCLPILRLFYNAAPPRLELTLRKPADDYLLSFRIELLRDSNELLNFYRDATDAQWSAMPIYRLLLEVLYSLSAPAVVEQMNSRSQRKYGSATFEAVLHNLCRIQEDSCVLARLVVHAAKGITSLMVDHQKNAAVAVAAVIVGAAKTVLTMKVGVFVLSALSSLLLTLFPSITF